MVALSGVSFSVESGEILSIIGENGAGKSTLMKIIGGVHAPDDGELIWEGQPLSLASPQSSLDRGIRVVFQELSGLENLSIAANLFLGREPKIGPFINDKEIRNRSEKILQQIGLHRSPDELLGTLSIAERQLVEIGRALVTELKLLILDEPTSSLTLDESERLFGLMRELASKGVAILYISHRLNEVQELSDRVVGLRDGQYVGELGPSEINHQSMIQMMVGRDLDAGTQQMPPVRERVRLSVSQLHTERFPNRSIDFELFEREILGIAGLVGAGRTEVVRALFGVDRCQGVVCLDGQTVIIKSPSDAIGNGIYLVPEDRRGAGLTAELSVGENIALPSLKQFSTWFANRKKEKEYAAIGIQKLSIKTSSAETLASTLSGGNQQKIVLARWMLKDPKVLMIDEPTRGIDVGSKSEIYEQIRQLAATGVSILMISSDMEEILKVSDRALVMQEGRVAGILNRDEMSEQSIMKLAVAPAQEATLA